MGIRVGIAGASGYSGAEVVRWLLGHPQVELGLLAAGTQQGREIAAVFPSFRQVLDRTLEEPDWRRLGAESDVVFLALPHGLALEAVPAILEGGARVVDLGADFRLRERSDYERWYGLEHTAPEPLTEAVYGLPELYRDEIRRARLIANPGCYPTAATLALYPLLERFGDGVEAIVVDAKSGVSGAGRGASLATHFGEVNENVRPYKVGEHRHTPELEQTLRSAGSRVPVFFTPHLVPMTRGILAACYVVTREPPTLEEAQAALRDAYAGETFVRVLDDGTLPETKATYGSNYCDLAVRVDAERRVMMALAAIDNLGKGAASQAVQNMNLLFGLEESLGIASPPLFP